MLSTDFEREALSHAAALFQSAFCLLQDRKRASRAVEETYRTASRNRPPRDNDTRTWLFTVLFETVRNQRPRFSWLSQAPPGNPPIAALSRLPLESREVLLLVDVEGFSHQQAASILQTPVETLRRRLSSARALFRDAARHEEPSYRLSAQANVG